MTVPGHHDYDVVVVGAGPVGLFLASELPEQGIRTLVVEQLAVASGESRASILHARTMELLDDRGLLDKLGDIRRVSFGHFAGLPLDLAEAVDHRYAGQWQYLQSELESDLERHAREVGVEIWRGHTVTGLRCSTDDITLTVHDQAHRERPVVARYVVGCDGEHSTVRRLAGFDLAGHHPERLMLRADIDDVRLENRRLRRYPRGVATAFRRDNGTTRLMVHRFGDRNRPAQLEFDTVAAKWKEVTGESIGHATPLWLNAFDDISRQVTEYRRDRALLAGDAAHQQMPIGGQALNLGLQDAANLGWKLATAIRGGDGSGLLDSYHRERHAAGARTLTNIRAQSLLQFGEGYAALRQVFGELLGIGDVRKHLAMMLSGLDTAQSELRREPSEVRKSTSALNHVSIPTRGVTMERLIGKTALVTGSSRGIGRATAVRLGREGALVAVHYGSNESAADDTVAMIESEGGKAFSVRAELGVPGDAHELFTQLERQLKERHGEARLDVLVNNAGVTTTGQAPEEVTGEDFDRYFAVNVKAPYFIVQRAVEIMPAGGRIINISSGLTRTANPDQVVYSMTKGAIEQLTLHLARHYAPRGISINSVAPGITNNGGAIFDVPEAVEAMAQYSAFKRVGDAGDVADIVTFLATDEARWMTGSFVDATGGTLLG